MVSWGHPTDSTTDNIAAEQHLLQQQHHQTSDQSISPNNMTQPPTTSFTPLINSSTSGSGGGGGGGGGVGVSDGGNLTNNITATTALPQQQQIMAEPPQLTAEELIAGFPEDELRDLVMKISNSRWVVPVLPKQEVECLLNYAIKLTKAGIDHKCESCMRFYRESLCFSFTKILTDDAVNTWKFNIHFCILNTCGKLLQLCALHMTRDNPYLLELLAIVLDPENKFNIFNKSRKADQYTTIIQPAVANTSATITSQTSGVPLTQSSTEPIITTTVIDGGGNAIVPPIANVTNQPINTASTSSTTGNWGILTESQIFARSPPEPRNPRGWLVDLINRFGQFGGFDNLQARFNAGIALLKQSSAASTSTNSTTTTDDDFKTASSTSLSSSTSNNNSNNNNNNNGTGNESQKITLQLIHSLLRPFGQCYELLTVETIEKYFKPIWEVVLGLMDGLSDDDLKREAKPENRSDSINGIVKAARALASRLPNQESLIKDLEMFRLKMILRLLKVSSFNGKMNALNEINKMLSAVTFYPHRPACHSDDDMDWLTAERMAAWIKETDVLGIVLRDSLHQTQYVEKLEKIIRFLIKEKALTLDDLDAVWRAQDGKHETIVKNVHDLLAKLAWDFNSEQLDHLFDCFEASMSSASKRQRDRLLELIRRLAEDDKNGVMAHKVLKRFWQLAHSPDISQDVMDQALGAHVKILDYSCSKEKDAQKSVWLDNCAAEVKNGENWVLPALRLIREICCLYDATPNHMPRLHNLNRQQVIERLQNEHSLVILVTKSLTTYQERVRTLTKDHPEVKPGNVILDSRYPHPQQIQERLDFLKFLLKDGQLWLCADQARQIWQCLAVNAVFPSDREECFRWFGKLMGDEPDLDPGINKEFFENNFLQLDPQLLSESGIKCFERFFKAVNSKEEKLIAKERGYVLDDEDLVGKDYLWRVITMSSEEIAMKAIELLIEVSTALGPRLQADVTDFHENFIGECCDRLRTYYDNIVVLTKTIEGGQLGDGSDKEQQQLHENVCRDIKMRQMEAEKMCRVIRVLQEYIKECDRTFTGDRFCLPLIRAHRGKHITLYIRFTNVGRPIEDVEFLTHANEMVSSLKRNLLKKIKGTSMTNIKVEFFYHSGDQIEILDDRNPISQYVRDKTMITAKLTAIGAGLSSNSPDSSSDSSTGSPPRPSPDVQRPESERTLPGIIISHKPPYIEFFLTLYQMGSDLGLGFLRDSCGNLLHLLPLDILTIQKLNNMCFGPMTLVQNTTLVTNKVNSSNVTTNTTAVNVPVTEIVIAEEKVQQLTPEIMFLHCSPAQVLYNLEVLHALLKPAIEPFNLTNLQFQSAWVHSGVAHFILDLLTKNNFLPNADMHTKRAAFQNVLRLAKIFLYIVGSVLSKVGDEPTSCTDFDSGRSQIEILKSTLISIFGNAEQTIRTLSSRLAENLATEMLSAEPEGDACRALFETALQWSCPNLQTIRAIVQLAWASACGCLHKLGSSYQDFSQEIAAPEQEDQSVCKDALEVLTISLVLNPEANEALSRDPIWSNFIISIVLMNPMRIIRLQASEQLYFSCTFCAGDWRPFAFTIKCLVDSLQTLVPHHSATCAEYFSLLCRTLNYGCKFNWPLESNDTLLEQEIGWLRSVKDVVRERGETQVHEDLLEGHLGLTKELMSFLPVEIKCLLKEFIVELVDDFLFPASRQYLHLRRKGQIINADGPPPVCRSPHTVAAACDLLVALCQSSIPNMKLIVNTLVDMFFSDTEPLREWEYLSPVGPRPYKGFAGLKNAGATCYMNSVLQQLFMVPMIRNGILSAVGAATDPNEDFSGETDSSGISTADLYDEGNGGGNNRNQYHIGILKHVQAIFAHLGHSALQFYVPRGLWSHFKLQGEPVNLREQQDAVEFFMSLFESLDEGLKALGHPQLMGATLGGCFSDQKICQGCPHRYSKEEPFSVFSVDIRNHSSLTESLEQYVKGELLEGADAYHCDKCDKKVVTVKRLCVQKLPKVLAIQLKRFEYDYERVCAIKFNDYFEFPRILNMEPYTVSGLAKIENKMIDVDDQNQINGSNVDNEESTTPTTYQLTGIVVHSGQASGGHYFSYILHRDPSNGKEQWYKFDDGEVTECKMHDDEEMKAQCFGGEYMGEVYDNNLKRMQLRRQKRWWNAYMLFYTRCDQTPAIGQKTIEQLSLAESRNCILQMPMPIEKSVRSQNLRFLHSRNLFSAEFFNFIRKLVDFRVQTSNAEKLSPHAEELSLLAVQLASKFLFHSGFRTKKTLRGPASDWYEEYKIPVHHWFDTLSLHIRQSAAVRSWFAQNALLNPPHRLSEYILIAPSPEVRLVFVRFVALCCIFSGNDLPLPGHDGQNLCEQILISALQLLENEVAEHGKHLPYYFQLFSMYASSGIQQKHQLIKLNVPAIFMKVAIGEGPGPPIKYHNVELSKLHQVVSMLVRCCDISANCQNSTPNKPAEPNAYVDPNVPIETMSPLCKEASECLFGRSSYVKKLIEDSQSGEDGLKLLQYCSWENPPFSRSVLTELLWFCGFTCLQDLRHHTDLLLHFLLIEDSWQNHRIHNALLGVVDERDGLLVTIENVKKHYPKRAYQIIKCLVQLFRESSVAADLLNSVPMISKQWQHAVEWLQEELERRGASNQYNYNSWSPPGQSYETTNSNVLERSQSVKNTLRMACELCPDEEPEPNDSDVEQLEEVTDPQTVAVSSTIVHAPIATGDGGIGNGGSSSTSIGGSDDQQQSTFVLECPVVTQPQQQNHSQITNRYQMYPSTTKITAISSHNVAAIVATAGTTTTTTTSTTAAVGIPLIITQQQLQQQQQQQQENSSTMPPSSSSSSMSVSGGDGLGENVIYIDDFSGQPNEIDLLQQLSSMSLQSSSTTTTSSTSNSTAPVFTTLPLTSPSTTPPSTTVTPSVSSSYSSNNLKSGASSEEKQRLAYGKYKMEIQQHPQQ